MLVRLMNGIAGAERPRATSSGVDVLLVTPPLLPLNEFPELGMPQVAGYLLEQGIACEQRDLNAELLYRWLARPPWPERLEREAGATAGPEGGSPRLGASGIEGVRRWVETCGRHLGLDPPRYEVDAVVAAVQRGHPVYEAFFAEELVAPRQAPPKVLGLSVMSSSQLVPSLLLARMARERWPGCAVIVGGPWTTGADSILESALARLPWIDAFVVGRGEAAALAVLRAVAASPGSALEGVPNLVCRSGGRVLRRAVAAPVPLDELPPPSFDGLDLDLLPARLLPVQTATRCHWGQCVFCFHDFRGTPASSRAAARVVADMAHLSRRYGTSSFFFADSATPVATMTAVAGEIAARGERLRWSTLARASWDFTPEVCGRLAASGCRVLLFGLETSSARGLQLLRKGITPAMVEHSVRSCAAAGIAAYLFVLDYPGNTVDELRATLEFVVTLAPWVEDVIPSRFQLSEITEVSDDPGVFDLRRMTERDTWLDPFDVPFAAPGMMPLATYQALVAEHLERFFAARPYPRRDPYLLAAGP
jgi:radical SAM superfamily enzyme YgiQ (UPF0313 family)